MLALQVYVPSPAVHRVRDLLSDHAGVDHVVQVGDTADGNHVLLTADIDANVVDTLLPALAARGVSGDDIAVIHQDSNRPLGTVRR